MAAARRPSPPPTGGKVSRSWRRRLAARQPITGPSGAGTKALHATNLLTRWRALKCRAQSVFRCRDTTVSSSARKELADGLMRSVLAATRKSWPTTSEPRVTECSLWTATTSRTVPALGAPIGGYFSPLLRGDPDISLATLPAESADLTGVAPEKSLGPYSL